MEHARDASSKTEEGRSREVVQVQTLIIKQVFVDFPGDIVKEPIGTDMPNIINSKTVFLLNNLDLKDLDCDVLEQLKKLGVDRLQEINIREWTT